MAALIPDILLVIGPFLDIASHQQASHVNKIWRESLCHAKSWPRHISPSWLPFLHNLSIPGLEFLHRLQPRSVTLSQVYSGGPLIIPHIPWRTVRDAAFWFKVTDNDLFWLTERTPKLGRLIVHSRSEEHTSEL